MENSRRRFQRRPPVSHPARGTLLDYLRRPQRGVTPFSMEKLSYWLHFFPILREGVTTLNVETKAEITALERLSSLFVKRTHV
jgi:hypothetical protein